MDREEAIFVPIQSFKKIPKLNLSLTIAVTVCDKEGTDGLDKKYTSAYLIQRMKLFYFFYATTLYFVRFGTWIVNDCKFLRKRSKFDRRRDRFKWHRK